MHKLLFLIPNYNHPSTIECVVRACLRSPGDVLIVDDGSNSITKEKIAKAASLSDRINVITLPVNGGKGAAVLAGFHWALQHNYTHVFQLDADAQQDLNAIPYFIKVSNESPNKMICGYPIYDDTVPLSRKWGRLITRFWVMINTLSLAYRDCLCGFRIYPLKAIDLLLKHKPALGLRMDFDCDILVQLYWIGIEPQNCPVKIFYPPNGVSHFHPIENWYLTKMHARHFFGMLKRLPTLLGRHLHA